jgi:hypothetical protein
VSCGTVVENKIREVTRASEFILSTFNFYFVGKGIPEFLKIEGIQFDLGCIYSRL